MIYYTNQVQEDIINKPYLKALQKKRLMKKKEKQENYKNIQHPFTLANRPEYLFVRIIKYI